MTRAAPGAPATDVAGCAAVALAIEAGRCLMAHFQAPIVARNKLDPGNIVTAADVESEQLIVAGLRKRFPDHSIIAEESGVDLRGSELTWIVDPLDGTSNFAAGIPWFGVLIAQLERGEPRLAVLHLPASDELYVAERGRGALRNGRPIAVARDAALRDVLWAYGIDTGGDDATQRARLAVLRALIASVRNVRTTNSLLDAAFTADARRHAQRQHAAVGHRRAVAARPRGRGQVHQPRRHAAAIRPVGAGR